MTLIVATLCPEGIALAADSKCMMDGSWFTVHGSWLMVQGLLHKVAGRDRRSGSMVLG